MAHMEKFKAAALGAMFAHYERTAEEERGFERENIDPSRTHLNWCVERCEGSPVDFVNDRIAGLGLKRRPRKDAVRMVDVVVTMPEGYDGDAREFFDAVVATIDGVFGHENRVGAWVHMDEASPHVHYSFVPVTGDGRLSAKDVCARSVFNAFHKTLEKGVCARLGRDRVGLLLTDEERSKKAAKYVSLPEYKDARAAAEQAAAEAEAARAEADAEAARLESLRRSGGELESIAKGGVGGLAAAAEYRGDGARERRAEEEVRALRDRAAALEAERERAPERVRGLEREAGRARREVGGLERACRRLEEEVRGLLRRVWTWVADLPERVRDLARDLGAHEEELDWEVRGGAAAPVLEPVVVEERERADEEELG